MKLQVENPARTDGQTDRQYVPSKDRRIKMSYGGYINNSVTLLKVVTEVSKIHYHIINVFNAHFSAISASVACHLSMLHCQ
jgi:hypothetical protein